MVQAKSFWSKFVSSPLVTVVYCLCMVLFLAPPDSWFAMWSGVGLKKCGVLSD